MAAVTTEPRGYYRVEISLPEPEFIPTIKDWYIDSHGSRRWHQRDGHDGELVIRAAIGRNVDVADLMRRVEIAMNELGLEST